MLTFEDCVAYCQLNEEEIAAISEHEHIPEMVAVELGEYLVNTDDGERRISRMIFEDIENHDKRGDYKGANRLRLILKHFVVTHPKAQESGLTGLKDN